MNDAVWIALGGLGLNLIALLVSNARQQGAFQEFKEYTSKRLNGLPDKVARLEQIAHEHTNRITKHSLESDHQFEKIWDEMRKR